MKHFGRQLGLFRALCPTVGLSGAVIGMSAGWTSAAHRSTAADGELDAARRQTLGAYCAGLPAGGLALGLASRFIGYRMSVVLCQFLAFVGWLLLTQAAAPLVDEQLVVVLGRFVHGLAAGGLGLLAPTYIAHTANFDLRGARSAAHPLLSAPIPPARRPNQTATFKGGGHDELHRLRAY